MGGSEALSRPVRTRTRRRNQRFVGLSVGQRFPEQYYPLAPIAFWHVVNICPMNLRVRLEVPAHLLPESFGPVVQGGKSGSGPIFITVFFHRIVPKDSYELSVTN